MVINVIISSKGGLGKTCMAISLHLHYYKNRLPGETITLVDMNDQNKDLASAYLGFKLEKEVEHEWFIERVYFSTRGGSDRFRVVFPKFIRHGFFEDLLELEETFKNSVLIVDTNKGISGIVPIGEINCRAINIYYLHSWGDVLREYQLDTDLKCVEMLFELLPCFKDENLIHVFNNSESFSTSLLTLGHPTKKVKELNRFIKQVRKENEGVPVEQYKIYSAFRQMKDIISGFRNVPSEGFASLWKPFFEEFINPDGTRSFANNIFTVSTYYSSMVHYHGALQQRRPKNMTSLKRTINGFSNIVDKFVGIRDRTVESVPKTKKRKLKGAAAVAAHP